MVKVSKSLCPVSDTLRSTIVPNTDIFIIITARPSNKRGFTARCAADQKYRPTIAHINIAPEFLEITPYKKLLNTAIHEIGHALGFSPFYYNYYLDAYGVPRGKSNVIRKFQERGHEVLKLITPSAVRAARRHFGSMLVNGLELEDSGGKGTAQAHVEKRIYGNEIMTGWPSSLLGVASDILLSVFEDMGWYRVSKNYAESLHHGNGEGLQFAERRCNKWPRTYFCSSMNAEIGCTADGRAKAFCQNFEFKSQLPSHYQYFSDPRKGGYSELNDHCPIFNMQPLSCADASSKGSYRKIEVFGQSSRCFVSRYNAPIAAACFGIVCEDGRYKVVVADGREFFCYENQLSVLIDNTVFECRSYRQTCQTHEQETCNDGKGCSGNGFCGKDGTCLCYNGRTGSRCQNIYCPKGPNALTCSGRGRCDEKTQYIRTTVDLNLAAARAK